MTTAQLFMFEPIALILVLGLGMVFARQVNSAFRGIDRLPPRTVGAIFILVALAFGLLTVS